MSRSEYRNVFFYYKGPSPKAPPAAAEQAVDRQLENNASKALINLLEHSTPALTRSFLREVVGVNVDYDRDGFVYTLQGADKDAKAAKHRHLVGLSVPGTVEVLVAGDAEHGVIDAAICLPGELFVAFEVKIGSGILEKPQLDRHAKDWDIPEDARLVRWATIYEWAAGERSRPQPEVTRFLLGQFVEFLQLTGLAPFAGFRANDFSFFENPTWEKQPEVKGRLMALWEEVLKVLPAGDRQELGEIHVGKLGLARTAHAQSNWGQAGVNLTTELYANELQVNMVGWRHDDAARFRAWLLSGAGQQRLKGLTDHQLVVYCRTAVNIDKREAGAKPFFRRERVRSLGSRAAGEASQTWISGLHDRLDGTWEKSAFHLRRTWSRDEVVDRGKAIAREVADEVERLLPLVREINAKTAG